MSTHLPSRRTYFKGNCTSPHSKKRINIMKPTNILTYLDTSAARYPDKLAFIGEASALTFLELKSNTEAIGSFIADKNIYNEPILVFMEKSPEEVSALLGVVRSGNFYVALDLDMSEARLDAIMAITKAKLIIVDGHTREKAKNLGFRGDICSYEEALSMQINDELLLDISHKAKETDTIYLVFTSGSTGEPKGVVASHRNVIDYIEGLGKVLECDENTVFGNQAPLYLDASLKDVYTTLKYGAATYFIPKKLFMSPVKLIEYVNEHKINTICFVSSALTIFTKLSAFDFVKPEYLKVIAFGGEVLPISHLKQWMKACHGARFINLYGATECTGMSSYYVVYDVEKPENGIPIGKPLPDTEIFLIDEEGNILANPLLSTEISSKNEGSGHIAKPDDTEIFGHSKIDLSIGKLLTAAATFRISEDSHKVKQSAEMETLRHKGEICIGGTGLSSGYYKDEEKTKAKFVNYTLTDGRSILLYKTGDIGYFGEDGELFFAGRGDNQIKHRGYRIELEEIESCGGTFEGVDRGCCIYNPEKEVITFFYEGRTEEAKVKENFRNKLASYMVPGKIIRLDRLPCMAGGKIDRKALLKLI